MLVAISALYLAYVEVFRTIGRAEVEKTMRANFEQNLCAPDQVDGDICLSDPDRGMCLSGEYIDYRTVFGRFTTVDGARRITARAFREQGSLQRLANWFACQGFEENTSLRLTRGPNYIRFNTKHSNGYGPFQLGYPPALIGHYFGIYLSWISVKIEDGTDRVLVRAGANMNFDI